MANTKTRENLFKLVLTALLAAMVIGLQLISIFKIGPFTITLALIPIVFGAITLGKIPGTVLGLIFGLVVSIQSVTGMLGAGALMVFQANPVMAWILCICRGLLAGFLPAVIYKAFKDKKFAPWVLYGVSGASLFAVGAAVGKLGLSGNTVLSVVVFILCSLVAAAYLLIIYFAMSKDAAPAYLASMTAPIANTGLFLIGMFLFFRPTLETWAGGSDVFVYAITGLVGINFVIEFTLAVVFTPAISMLAEKMMNKRKAE